jgi:hypothetical protein
MASALDSICHVILPNVMKLKGAATIVSGLERRDVTPFTHVWAQTGIEHTPQVVAKERDVWRIGVMSMPKPTDMGEAHMVAFVAKKNDVGTARYFTLEHDFVLKTGAARTSPSAATKARRSPATSRPTRARSSMRSRKSWIRCHLSSRLRATGRELRRE